MFRFYIIIHVKLHTHKIHNYMLTICSGKRDTKICICFFIAPGLYRPVHRNRMGIVRYTFVFEFESEKETVN